LGYQKQTAQSYSLKVATSGPRTRSAYWLSGLAPAELMPLSVKTASLAPRR
jgi:hypothetical protein